MYIHPSELHKQAILLLVSNCMYVSNTKERTKSGDVVRVWEGRAATVKGGYKLITVVFYFHFHRKVGSSVMEPTNMDRSAAAFEENGN